MGNLVQLSGFKVVILATNVPSMESFVRQVYQLSLNIDVKIISSLNSEFPEFHSNEVQVLIIDLSERQNISKKLLLRYKRVYPQLKIMVFCDNVKISVIKKLFSAGIQGYLTKNIAHYELGIALEKAMTGESYVSIEISGKLASHFLLNKSK